MMTEYHHLIGSGLALVCEIEYDPGEAANPDIESGTCCPETPARAWFCSATLLGVDVTDILAEHLKDYIEERALCSMQPSL